MRNKFIHLFVAYSSSAGHMPGVVQVLGIQEWTEAPHSALSKYLNITFSSYVSLKLGETQKDSQFRRTSVASLAFFFFFQIIWEQNTGHYQPRAGGKSSLPFMLALRRGRCSFLLTCKALVLTFAFPTARFCMGSGTCPDM